MGWPLSILVGVLGAAVAGAGSLGLGLLCARWYRVSSFEGKSGYFVVAFGLLGLLLGFVIGLGSARHLAAGPDPGFAHALGLAVAITAALLALAAGGAWLAADFPPTIDGRELALEVEVRLPAGAALPPYEEYGWHVTITGDHGDRRQSTEALRRGEAVLAEGRWTIPARVWLPTAGRHSIGVKLAGAETQYFRPDWPGPPARRDMEWGPWQQGPTAGNLAPIPPGAAVEIRTRLQFLPQVEP
jgi:hypothetical protein